MFSLDALVKIGYFLDLLPSCMAPLDIEISMSSQFIMSYLHSEVRLSCLQATTASLKSHKSAHTVPHCPW